MLKKKKWNIKVSTNTENGRKKWRTHAVMKNGCSRPENSIKYGKFEANYINNHFKYQHSKYTS